MITVGKPYWTVNVPYAQPLKARREATDRLKEAGYTAKVRGARMTKPQAEAMAAKIHAELNLRMEVNETSDLGGF